MVDMLVLEASASKVCEFESHHPHQKGGVSWLNQLNNASMRT